MRRRRDSPIAGSALGRRYTPATRSGLLPTLAGSRRAGDRHEAQRHFRGTRSGAIDVFLLYPYGLRRLRPFLLGAELETFKRRMGANKTLYKAETHLLLAPNTPICGLREIE